MSERFPMRSREAPSANLEHLERDIEKSADAMRRSDLLERSIEGLARTAAVGVFALNVATAEAAPKASTERVPDAEQREILKNVIGMPAAELERDYTIEISVKAGKDNVYIVHGGVMHRSDRQDPAARAALTDRTIATQKNVETVLKGMTTTGKLECVFAEGFATDKGVESNKRYIEDATRKIRAALSSDIRSLDQLNATSTLHDAVERVVQKSSLLRHHLSPLLSTLKQKIDTATQSKAIPLHSGAAHERVQLITHKLSGATAEVDPPNPYLGGAAFKAYLDGTVTKLCPAENDETNKQALAAEKEYREANRAYRDALRAPEHMVLDAEGHKRLQTLKHAHDTALGRMNALIYTARESDALNRIHEFDQKIQSLGQPLGHVAVVYGYDHNFADAVRRWNAEHPTEVQRGLIKLTPKQ